LRLPLVVRYREAGDRFWPLGLAGEKKVGKFLTAAKVPQQIRKKVLVVSDNEKIIWLWPIRISEQAKIAGETKKAIQLQITEYPAQGAGNGYLTRNCKKTLAK
jgi:tRNA(Ile)-lysidine synthase